LVWNQDFFYICPGHLTDPGFASPVINAEAEAAKAKKAAMDKEIEKVKLEYEEKQKKKKEKKKAKKGDDKDKDKKKEDEEDEGKAEKERDDKVCWQLFSRRVATAWAYTETSGRSNLSRVDKRSINQKMYHVSMHYIGKGVLW
jgi:AAA-ATPase Vps4-associated protein 1